MQDDDKALAMIAMLDPLIDTRLAKGEIDEARADMLKSLVREFKEAALLPLEIRSTRMRDVMQKLNAQMGLPQGLR